MPDPQTLSVFAIACAALVAIPGPAVLYIVGRSVADGRRAGLVSMLGIETGNLAQVFAAAAGRPAISLSSATAFSAAKSAGAAYVVSLRPAALLERRRLTRQRP